MFILNLFSYNFSLANKNIYGQPNVNGQVMKMKKLILPPIRLEPVSWFH